MSLIVLQIKILYDIIILEIFVQLIIEKSKFVFS